MIIETIRLKDFRNYELLTLHPHPGINLFFGQNGSGKTNLLEAIHYCALGRSHRTREDREVVRRGSESGAIGLTVRREMSACDIQVRLTPDGSTRKQVFIDRKRVPRLSDMMGRLQCVIFSPEDLMIIKEGPSGRRRFLDMLLSQLEPSYFVALQQYQKALEERNAILRDMKKNLPVDTSLLDAYEQAMAVPCAAIIPQRRSALERLGRVAAEKYAAISGNPSEHFALAYDCCVSALPEAVRGEKDEKLAGAIREYLAAHRREDAFRGGTSFGIHREDLLLTLNGREMKQFASQGQIRTAALSLKLAQLTLFREATGETPVLLLDDVMSELDMTRRTRLLDEIRGVQTFVTCTDESDLDGCRDRRTYHVAMDERFNAGITETSGGAAVAERTFAEPDFS